MRLENALHAGFGRGAAFFPAASGERTHRLSVVSRVVGGSSTRSAVGGVSTTSRHVVDLQPRHFFSVEIFPTTGSVHRYLLQAHAENPE